MDRRRYEELQEWGREMKYRISGWILLTIISAVLMTCASFSPKEGELVSIEVMQKREEAKERERKREEVFQKAIDKLKEKYETTEVINSSWGRLVKLTIDGTDELLKENTYSEEESDELLKKAANDVKDAFSYENLGRIEDMGRYFIEVFIKVIVVFKGKENIVSWLYDKRVSREGYLKKDGSRSFFIMWKKAEGKPEGEDTLSGYSVFLRRKSFP